MPHEIIFHIDGIKARTDPVSDKEELREQLHKLKSNDRVDDPMVAWTDKER